MLGQVRAIYMVFADFLSPLPPGEGYTEGVPLGG
jgi:hypothetical protein